MTHETDWQSALADIEAALTEERAATGDAAIEAATDITLACFKRLLEIRPPTVQDAHRKLEIIRDVEAGSPSEIAWDAILGDLHALSLFPPGIQPAPANAPPAMLRDACLPEPNAFSNAIISDAIKAGLTVNLITSDQTRWETDTFSGSRCMITITVERSKALVDWLAQLPNAETGEIEGELIADIAVTNVAAVGGVAAITIEGLTVMANAED